MQREKALAFFDLTIRQKPSALKTLMDPGYSAEGLVIESRNF